MAGRGVDIKLGGNAEHLTQLELAKLGLRPGDPDYAERYADILPAIEARVEEGREKVMDAGGLFICGTERHESRRIDNQLRGRAGRQGDPGRVALLPVRRGRARPPVRRRPHLSHPRPPRPRHRRGRGGADRGEDALEADRERAAQGRGAELPHPQARPRVRRRDEPAARDRLPVPRPRAGGPGHGPDGARADRRRHRAPRRGVHAGRLRRGVGPRRPVGAARPGLPRRLRAGGARPRGDRPHAARRASSSRTR